ncbi:hypothetical protein JXC34_02085 [Candidatus Woesearchaeota archaeon]|nr:hypothetical protein [Candidatus Woesearchaeota archaeon]
MESAVSYMKDSCGMTYHEIALALNRDDRTIWTVYKRSLQKKVQNKSQDKDQNTGEKQ